MLSRPLSLPLRALLVQGGVAVRSGRGRGGPAGLWGEGGAVGSGRRGVATTAAAALLSSKCKDAVIFGTL